MELHKEAFVNTTEITFFTKGEVDLVSDNTTSVWPRKITILYKWWGGVTQGEEYSHKGWSVSVQGKCPSGSPKKTSTITFSDSLEDYNPSPEWVRDLVENHAPSKWMAFTETTNQERGEE